MKQKWIKNGSFLIICALMTFVYFQTKEEPEIDKEVVITDFDGYREVVYMDEDSLLIPVTYALQQSPNIEDDVLQVFTLMKDPGNLKTSLQSIIPKEASLLSASIDDNGILNLNFNQGLDKLQATHELRFLEATSYVFCQLDGIEGVTYAMEGESLNCLPNGKITLSAPIDEGLGINNFETSDSLLHHTMPMQVYFAKTIENQEFYVPITKRVSNTASLDEQLNGVLGEISVSSTLNQASPLEPLELLEGSSLENGHLCVNLNAMVLLDETTLDEEVYDLLLLSLSALPGVEEIAIQVQGQEMNMPESQKVSEIVYNVVKI